MQWNRLPGEPNRWYNRFEIYRHLGPPRTIEAAYRASAITEDLKAQRPGTQWYTSADKWQWQHRAEAWDDAERKRLQAIEGDRRFDAREHRLTMINKLLKIVYTLLIDVEMPAIHDGLASLHLPSLRIFFRDLLSAHRIELGPPLSNDNEGGPTVAAFTADELIRAEVELDEWRAGFPTTPPPNGFVTLRNVLARIYPDEASARRIADQVGLNRSHIDFSGLAVNTWHTILTMARDTDTFDTLIAIVSAEYDGSMGLRRALAQFKQENP